MILSFQQLKGGCGKTTLALHVAAALALGGKRVLFLDADPQGSAIDWAATRGGDPLFNVVGMPRPVIHKELPTLATGFDFVVIDTPPRAADVARSALMVADLVVLPVTPSQLDVWALDASIRLAQEAQAIRPALKSAIVVNRKITNTAMGRDVADALHAYGLPVLNAQLAQRIAFAESIAVGQTVMETAPRSPAALEVSALVDELKTMMR